MNKELEKAIVLYELCKGVVVGHFKHLTNVEPRLITVKSGKHDIQAVRYVNPQTGEEPKEQKVIAKEGDMSSHFKGETEPSRMYPYGDVEDPYRQLRSHPDLKHRLPSKKELAAENKPKEEKAMGWPSNSTG
jgi:hypothetical protein